MRGPLPFRVSFATPCKASWDGMVGNGRVRFCAACRKNVYNLSDMTRAEAEALLSREGGPPCVTYFQRADGTVMTQDCTVGRLARARRRVASALTAAASLLLGAWGSADGAPRETAPRPGPAVHSPDGGTPSRAQVAERHLPEPDDGERPHRLTGAPVPHPAPDAGTPGRTRLPSVQPATAHE